MGTTPSTWEKPDAGNDDNWTSGSSSYQTTSEPVVSDIWLSPQIGIRVTLARIVLMTFGFCVSRRLISK